VEVDFRRAEVMTIEAKRKKRGAEKVKVPEVDFDMKAIREIKERKKKVGPKRSKKRG